MRFDRLDLVRWGALADVSLDLSQGEYGLHVVYGDNEAGKSTTRRAIAALLFGIPARSSDNFRFDYRSLRVGGALRFATGDTLTLRRRKGNKDTVLGADEEPISDSPLLRALGGIDREAFEQEWSLDHAALRQGGQALLEGKGELGQSLLAAGLGGIGVAAIQADLDAEAHEIFGKRGGKVAQLLDRLKDARRSREQFVTKAKDVDDLRARLLTSSNARDAAAAAREALDAEIARLDRAARALGPLAERDRLTSELARFATTRLLSVDFGKRRVAAEEEFARARHDLATARDDLAHHEAALAAIVPDARVVALAKQIEAVVAGAEADRARSLLVVDHEASLARWTSDIARLAGSVGIPRDALVQLAEGPYRPRSARARELAASRADLTARQRAADERLRSALDDRDRIEAWMEAAGPMPDDEALLATALERVEAELGGSAKALQALRERQRKAQLEFGEALARVETWPLTADALANVALPSLQEIDSFEERFLSQKRTAEAHEAERQAEEELQRRSLDVTRLVAADVPTEASLAAARADRSAAWREVRSLLTGGTRPEPGRRDDADRTRVTSEYEVAVERADALADRLRVDTARAARLEAATGERAAAAEALEAARRRAAAALAADEAVTSAWRRLFLPLAIEPGRPRAMREWVERVMDARALLRSEVEARANLAAEEARVRTELAPLARGVGLEDVSCDDVAVVVERAKARVGRASDARRARAESERALRDVSVALTAADRAQQAVRAELAVWDEEWTAFLETCGLDPAARPAEVVETFEQVREVAGLLVRTEDARRAMAQAVMESRAYRDEVERIAAALGRQQDHADVQLTVRWLDDTLRSNAALTNREATEGARVLDARRRVSREEGRFALAAAAVERLCAEAGVLVPEQLAGVEAENEERRALRASLETAERELAMVARDGIEGLRADIEAAAHVDVAARRQDLLELRTRESERERLASQDLGAIEHELAQASGGDRAAEEESTAQGVVAALGEASADYLRVRFAADLLARAARAYRERNESPMLKAAGELLGRLTLGSFARVVVDDAGDGGRVLKGERPGGELVAVEGMSDGVRDQLFLALRLAALERQLERREALPFVIDDVLINLSDDRAAATLEVLAGLASKTQVLLFTHHARVADLALAMRGREVFVHRVGRVAGA